MTQPDVVTAQEAARQLGFKESRKLIRRLRARGFDVEVDPNDWRRRIVRVSDVERLTTSGGRGNAAKVA